ncbi:MAG: NAD-dependent epimerase/dehydratase family protein [Pseudooceanicola nanhaiensis]|uniref:NAD-dependent epimerase/dehydratase family protein n=1 Tax=Pseudooceanicola nanhaiensis TaxID=375761 RepID=UPI00405A21A9
MTENLTLGVVGATGRLGARLARRLRDETGARLVLTARDPMRIDIDPDDPRIALRALDLDAPEAAARSLAECDAVVFCPILTQSVATAEALRRIAPGVRIVAVSSNNVGLDRASELYQALDRAEDRIRALPDPWAIVRPTMIYGLPEDGNLGRLLAVAMKSPVLPLPGDGRALQQPVHVHDLAGLAMMLALGAGGARAEVTAAGAEVLSLRALYRKVCRAAGRGRFVLPVPMAMVARAVARAERDGRPVPMTTVQLRRAGIDKLPTWPLLPGWTPEVTLDAGLAAIAQELRRRRG